MGLEVVVRPLVFPDIRPRSKPSLPPQDDPEKGFAVIQGNPASAVGLSHSSNVSTSNSRPVESERRVDEVRVFQQDDDGTVNKENFIDLEVANRITMNEPAPSSGPAASVPSEPNDAPAPRQERKVDQVGKITYYSPMKANEHVEIRGKNKIRIYTQD